VRVGITDVDGRGNEPRQYSRGNSDVPGPAWAQASGLGWASQGSGLPKREPGPELRAGPGLGLVGLEPGLDFQKHAKWLGNTHLRSASYLHQ
jgi:hypothetical protein